MSCKVPLTIIADLFKSVFHVGKRRGRVESGKGEGLS